MSLSLLAPRAAPEVPLTLVLNQGGPVSGATAVVAVRDGLTNDSYLDFNDQTFKTVGWTTRQASLTEISAGLYVLTGGLILSTITNLPALSDNLIAEYEVTAPASVTGVAMDVININELTAGVAADVWTEAVRTLTAGTNIVLAKGVGVTGFNDITTAAILADILISGESVDVALSRLDNIDADVASIRLQNFRRGVAFADFMFIMRDSSGVATAGLTVSGEIRIDAAAPAAISGTVVDEGDGVYSVDLLSIAEMSGVNSMLRFSAAGAADSFVLIVTHP